MSRSLLKKLLPDLGALDSLPERCSLLLLAPPFQWRDNAKTTVNLFYRRERRERRERGEKNMNCFLCGLCVSAVDSGVGRGCGLYVQEQSDGPGAKSGRVRPEKLEIHPLASPGASSNNSLLT